MPCVPSNAASATGSGKKSFTALKPYCLMMATLLRASSSLEDRPRPQLTPHQGTLFLPLAAHRGADEHSSSARSEKDKASASEVACIRRRVGELAPTDRTAAMAGRKAGKQGMTA